MLEIGFCPPTKNVGADWRAGRSDANQCPLRYTIYPTVQSRREWTKLRRSPTTPLARTRSLSRPEHLNQVVLCKYVRFCSAFTGHFVFLGSPRLCRSFVSCHGRVYLPSMSRKCDRRIRMSVSYARGPICASRAEKIAKIRSAQSS